MANVEAWGPGGRRAGHLDGVARVVLKLADGRQYGAQTFAAWPGSGVRLWDFSVPGNLAFAGPHRVMIGYNAAGQVVWQMPLRG